MIERRGRFPDFRGGWTGWFLEYGVPLDTIPYQSIWSRKPDETHDEFELVEFGRDRVEEEARSGRHGAFVTTWQNPKTREIIVEVWSWAD